MSNTIYLSVAAIFYTFMVLVLFFHKRKVSTVENKIFSQLIVIIFFSLVTEVSLVLIKKDMNFFPFVFALKLYLVFLLCWLSTFSKYVYMITHRKQSGDNKKLYQTVSSFALVVNILLTLIIAILPIYFYDDGSSRYSYGPSVDMMFVTSISYSMLISFLTIKNIKKVSRKEVFPIFLLLFMMLVASAIQSMNRGVLLVNFVFAFVTVLTYHTLENPDVQIMEELYKNKKLIEKSSEDTSNFLFRMTQDIKRPIKDIMNMSNEMVEFKNKDDFKTGAKIIGNKARELDYLVNDALDVSSMSTKTIKSFNTRYNPQMLFKEVKYLMENKLDSKVKFEYSIAGNIPKYLYGDSIKLKQVIISVLDNAVKNTKKGFISLNVDSIIKYDLCRLLITISDSGEGMAIDEVNNILSLNIDELSKIKLSEEKKVYNLKEVKKLTTFLGGNLIVKSELEKGTTVSITFDQKIVETDNIIISKKLDLYEQSLHSNKKVMVVDDDAKELASITSKLEKMDAMVSGSLFGRDIIEKVSNEQKFDLILLDDETSTYSGLEVLKELKKNKKFTTPVIVMIDDGKEFIKSEYLKDGFADVILKSKLMSELERIMERF